MMLIFGLCFLLTVTSNETPLPNVDSIQKPTEEQLQKIELLDFQISQEKEPQGTHMMDLRNERGLLFLLLGQYENSLNDFDHVLQSSSSTTNVAFEAALWGKLFADAYSSQEEAAFEDLWLIRSAYTQQCISCSKKRNDFLERPESLLIAEFANPNENISSAECKERVRGTANVMRLLCARIPSVSLSAAVQYTISELESLACNCCNRNHWTECLTPITDAWHYLKNRLDRGLLVAPHLYRNELKSWFWS